MTKKQIKVVLFGGSNSIIKNGLQKGLQQENILLYNFALGATTSVQNLYELIRRQDEVKDADLIITESNINEINFNMFETKLSLEVIYRNLYYFYNKLSSFQKKIIILILPSLHGNYKIINNMHRYLGKKFSFNIIDMSNHYERYVLYDFHNSWDMYHPQYTIMNKLGKNIVKNIDLFLQDNQSKYVDRKKVKLNICLANDLVATQGKIKYCKYENSMYIEKVAVIDSKVKLKFPESYHGYKIIAIHTWNRKTNLDYKQCLYHISNICIKNNNKFILKATNSLNSVVELKDEIVIDSNTYVYSSIANEGYTEYHHGSQCKNLCKVLYDTLTLVGFLLLLPDKNEREEQINFESLAKEIIEIPKECNFNHLIPPVEWYKEIINEYCSITDPIKLQPLQNQINILNSTISSLEQNKIQLSQEKDKIQQDNASLRQTLNSLPIKKQQLEISNLEQDLINKKLQTKQLSKKLGIKMNDFMPKITMISPSSAKARIQNQLSYKLGQAMIVNSKSFLGYIRMPFVLSYIKDKHKQEQKIYQEKIKKDPSLALPPLEDYSDYKEALKEKKCLTYKLGQALIQANKTWYGGGISSCYLKLGS